MDRMENSEKALSEHLADLRGVVLKCLGAASLSAIVVFFFTPKIFKMIIAYPVTRFGVELATISPVEVLMSQLKLAFFGGIVISGPIIVPTIWGYLRPALSSRERSAIKKSLLPGVLLFIAGVMFAYFVILPLAVNFLFNLALEFDVRTVWTVSSYLSLVVSLAFSFGIAFELPVVIFALNHLGIISHDRLKGARRYVIVALFIIAAILTPPDVVSQLLLAVPLICLYEITILIIPKKG